MGWIFGYGSIIWNPSFAYLERSVATARGWKRRFWQGSTDHRGVPEFPGRVVTLARDRRQLCAGMVYRVDPVGLERIIEELDYREKGGYHRVQLELELADGRTVEALTYVAGPGNPNYLGAGAPTAVARQILRAVGPSGHNLDYLQRLARVLRELGIADEHVFGLERLCQRLTDRAWPGAGTSPGAAPPGRPGAGCPGDRARTSR